MKVRAINYNYKQNSYNPNMKAIIYCDSNVLSDELLDSIAEGIKKRENINPKGRSFNPELLKGKGLIEKVIESDFDTPDLKKRFVKLIESQKKNPVNIFVDLFSADGDIPLQADEWFQKATVGKLTFRQPTSSHIFGLIPQKESRITFLEKACACANILNGVNKVKRFFKL